MNINLDSREEGMDGRKKQIRAIDRFYESLERIPESGCWLWVKHVTRDGYGYLSLNRKHVAAHRFSYDLHKGKIPEGFQIDHLCRVRCCVNPFHLEAVTAKENCRRGNTGKVTGEKLRAKTHCPQGHKYTESNTYYYPVTNKRACRKCINMRNKIRRGKE